ncbi:MAG: 50S ribosomal protein L22 [Candidatus Sumerlaeia bacterium]
MSRARAARRPELGEFVASARARFQRVSARKARQVVDLIRGLTVAEANIRLLHMHRPSAGIIVENALKSAIANATVKYKEQEEKDAAERVNDLLVGDVQVDGGPIIKRFRPRAMGRACTIRKRMAHVTIKLYEQV